MITPQPSQNNEPASLEDDVLSQGMNAEEEDQILEDTPEPSNHVTVLNGDKNVDQAISTALSLFPESFQTQMDYDAEDHDSRLLDVKTSPLKRSRSISVNLADDGLEQGDGDRRSKSRRLMTPKEDGHCNYVADNTASYLGLSVETEEARSQSAHSESESEYSQVPNPEEVSPSPSSRFQCVGYEQCSAVFSNFTELSNHVEDQHHPTDTGFTCYCNMCLPSYDALFQHAFLVHPDQPEKNGPLLVDIARSRKKAAEALTPSRLSHRGISPTTTQTDMDSPEVRRSSTPFRHPSVQSSHPSRLSTPRSTPHQQSQQPSSARRSLGPIQLSQEIPIDNGDAPAFEAESSPIHRHPTTPSRNLYDSSRTPATENPVSKRSVGKILPQQFSPFTPVSHLSAPRMFSRSAPRISITSSPGMTWKPRLSGWKSRTSNADQSYTSIAELGEEECEEILDSNVPKGIIPGNVGFALNRTVMEGPIASTKGVTQRRASTVDRVLPLSSVVDGRVLPGGRAATQPPTSAKSRKSVTFTASTEALELTKTPQTLVKRSDPSAGQTYDWYSTPPASSTPLPKRTRPSKVDNDAPFTRPLFRSLTPTTPLQPTSVPTLQSNTADGQHEGPSNSRSVAPAIPVKEPEHTPDSSPYLSTTNTRRKETDLTSVTKPKSSKKVKAKRRETFGGFSGLPLDTKNTLPRVNLNRIISQIQRSPFIPRIIRWPSPDADTSPAKRPRLSLAAQRAKRQSLPAPQRPRQSSLSSLVVQPPRVRSTTSRRRSRFSLTNLPQPTEIPGSPLHITPNLKKRISEVDQDRALTVGLDVLLQGMAQHRGLSKEKVERVWRAVGDLEETDVVLGELAYDWDEGLKRILGEKGGDGAEEERDLEEVGVANVDLYASDAVEEWVDTDGEDDPTIPSLNGSESDDTEVVDVYTSQDAYRASQTKSSLKNIRSIQSHAQKGGLKGLSSSYQLHPPPSPLKKHRQATEETHVPLSITPSRRLMRQG